MLFDPDEIRDSAVTDADEERWYTVGQTAALVGLTRSGVEARVRRTEYDTTNEADILEAAPSLRGPRPSYLIRASQVDRQRAELLERLGAAEPTPKPKDGGVGAGRDVRRRLARLEPAYAAALRAQELAAEQRQRDADRAAADAEAQSLLLEQLRQFYGPVDVEDLLGS